MTKEEKKSIQIQRMEYSKDRIPSWFALLAILLNVFYFVSIYKTNVSAYYSFTIGLSVIINLLFMLATFLCSEGVKSYKKSYGVAMIVVGAIEIARIFYFPLKGITSVDEATGLQVMDQGQFVRVVIYLSLAAALLIAGGIMSIRNSIVLEKYLNEKNSK